MKVIVYLPAAFRTIDAESVMFTAPDKRVGVAPEIVTEALARTELSPDHDAVDPSVVRSLLALLV